MAALLVVMAGCGRQPEPLLRVGTNVWPGYEILYLARGLDMLDPDRVRLVELPATTDVMSGLRAGTLEAGALTLDEALTLRWEGLPVRVVAVLDLSDGADALVARPGIDNLAALRGRRIGAEKTALGAVMLDAVLEAAGLTAADVATVQLTPDLQRQAFVDGSVDAVVTFEPIVTQLRESGGRVLFDSSAIPGRIVDVLVARADAIDHHRRGLRALVGARFRALGLFEADPQAAVRRMAPRTGLTADQLLAAYQGLALPGLEDNRRMLAGDSPGLQDTVRRLVATMRAAGLINGAVDIDGFLSPAFLPAEPE